MKISIKNLKGEVFHVEAETTDLVSNLKAKIQDARADLVADRQKLIHSGKVLKDEQTVGDLGLAESDFIVCMVTKEVAKKPAPAAAPAAAAAPAPSSSVPIAPATPVAPTNTTTAPGAPASQAAPAVASPIAHSFVSAESVQALSSMGFPEAECRAALQAAMGNPDLAYEFLLTGIPERAPAAAFTAPAAPAAPQVNSTGIEQLRQHPQFNMLKQLVQQNPAAIPQVLDLISQQSPALYEAIQANNDAFIAMMNEPYTSDASAPVAPPVPQLPPAAGMPGAANLANALQDPAQMMQMLAALPPAQRAQFAQTLGMNPQELESFIMMMNSMPPEQLQQMLGGAGGGGGRPPARVVRLTEEEMAAVNRLTELGFSRQQAAEAYLACDKNEELAANLLLGGGFEDDMQDFGGDDGGDDHDHDDEMYS